MGLRVWPAGSVAMVAGRTPIGPIREKAIIRDQRVKCLFQRDGDHPTGTPMRQKLLQSTVSYALTAFVLIYIPDRRIIQLNVAICRRFFRACSRLFPALWPKAKHSDSSRCYSTVNGVAVCPGVKEYKGVNKVMSTNSGPLTEVLHSDKHSKLTAEEVAKAVARHNKNHSAAKAENAA